LLQIRELRSWARTLGPEEFRHQVGPFVLIQRPPQPLLEQAALQVEASHTRGMAKRGQLVEEILTMIQGFDNLAVAGLPPLGEEAEIRVGRLPDSDLMVDEPSVSKEHAVVRWDAAQGGCSVQDLGSKNGTFINAQELPPQQETLLVDGDVVGFGDEQFMYFVTEGFYAKLAGAGFARGG